MSNVNYPPPPPQYSRKFFLLSEKGANIIPDCLTQCEMEDGGLGEKVLNGSINESKYEVMQKLEKLFPSLLSAGGVRWMWELSFDQGRLHPITASSKVISGMSGRTLKNSGDYTIYLSPIQNTIEYEIEKIQCSHCYRCKVFFEFAELINHCSSSTCEERDWPDSPLHPPDGFNSHFE